MLKIEKHGEPNHQVSVKLLTNSFGVHLIAVDENGDPLPKGWIISLSNETGKLVLHKSVNPDLGLDLDEQGIIKTVVQ